MFAFVIYDKRAAKVIIFRDRAGVKPLYYYLRDGLLLFASELKALHKHPAFDKKLNKEVLPYYFQFGYIPAPYTIFQDCHKLEAGYYLEYDLERCSCDTREYWSVDACYTQEKFEKSEAEIVEELESVLTEAANLRMVSDVPVGVFLSGGYDSTLLTALLSKEKQRKLHTFTIGFKDERYNEAKHAAQIAKYFDTEHTEYYIDASEMLEKVASLPYYYDEPFGDSSSIPTMMVSELSRREVTVALSADGGDEAFCGYSKYFFLEKFSNIFASSFKRKLLQTSLNLFDESSVERLNSLLPSKVRQTNIRDKYNKFKRAINSSSRSEMFRNASSYVHSDEVATLIKIQRDNKLFSKFSIDEGRSFLDEMMRVDYQSFMVDDVLTKVDRATMSVSLEGREPFLDHKIIEFMARVPAQLKYKNSTGKYLAREILDRYIPRAITEKPKAGFQVPLLEWLRGDLNYLVGKYLDTKRIDDEIFDLVEIEKLKQELNSGQAVNVSKVWFVISFEMWREEWGV
jgi:asparagine synthase (glutamine-hydrolysing)